MTPTFRCFDQRLYRVRFKSLIAGCLALLWVPAAWMTTACTRFAAPEMQRDLAAEKIIAAIKHTNADLVQFKCVGKISLSGPEQPSQSYRGAIAGQLKDHLRIDLFAPFGGAAGTVASDGAHLFLVLHSSREYYKKRYGDGSLARFIKMNVTVSDLLEILVGRIPMHGEFSPRTIPGVHPDHVSVGLVDRWNNIRQQITLDASGRPLKVQWFDRRHQLEFSLAMQGHQVIDGFGLPNRIDLLGTDGQAFSVTLERYEANALLDESMFIPPPISS